MYDIVSNQIDTLLVTIAIISPAIAAADTATNPPWRPLHTPGDEDHHGSGGAVATSPGACDDDVLVVQQ